MSDKRRPHPSLSNGIEDGSPCSPMTPSELAPAPGSTNQCEDCGTMRPTRSGEAAMLPRGYVVLKLWCEVCDRKTWSLPFMPNTPDQPRLAGTEQRPETK